LLAAGITAEAVRDSELYQPARPAHIRQALREMPVQDVSGISYIDLGSGEGRTLFIAAELPFKQIIGLEFSTVLHEQACANIRRFQPIHLSGSRKRRCTNITSLHKNAKEFAFPEGKIVLYLFNPFGSATMRCVLSNLEASLKRYPRHANRHLAVAAVGGPGCRSGRYATAARDPGVSNLRSESAEAACRPCLTTSHPLAAR
jgi:hypothetical protein